MTWNICGEKQKTPCFPDTDSLYSDRIYTAKTAVMRGSNDVAEN